MWFGSLEDRVVVVVPCSNFSIYLDLKVSQYTRVHW